MKTRLSTNPERNSFRLDVIQKGEFESFYFTDLNEAINYQKYILSTDNNIEYYKLVKSYQNSENKEDEEDEDICELTELEKLELNDLYMTEEDSQEDNYYKF